MGTYVESTGCEYSMRVSEANARSFAATCAALWGASEEREFRLVRSSEGGFDVDVDEWFWTGSVSWSFDEAISDLLELCEEGSFIEVLWPEEGFVFGRFEAGEKGVAVEWREAVNPFRSEPGPCDG